MHGPEREYDDMELQVIDGIKHYLRGYYTSLVNHAKDKLPLLLEQPEPPAAAIDAWAKDIYERHCAAQGEHTEPSKAELAAWAAGHYPAARRA